VCQRQVEHLAESLGRTQAGVKINNRVVNELYGRVVTSTSPTELSSAEIALLILLPFLVLTLVGHAIASSRLCMFKLAEPHQRLLEVTVEMPPTVEAPCAVPADVKDETEPAASPPIVEAPRAVPVDVKEETKVTKRRKKKGGSK